MILCAMNVKVIGSDWPQIGKFWDFLRYASVHFGSVSKNVLKRLKFDPFKANLTQFAANHAIRCTCPTTTVLNCNNRLQ